MSSGWISDLLGYKKILDSTGTEHPARSAVRFLSGTVADNAVTATTDVTLPSGTAAIPAPALVATSNIALTGVVTVDGVASNTVTGDILAPFQTDPTKRGYWTPNASGAWTQPSYYNSNATIAAALGQASGAVLGGLLGAGTVWGQSQGATLAGAKTFIRLPDAAVKAAKINLPPPPVYVAITPVGPTDPLTGLPWPEPSGPSIYNDSANIALTTQRINAALVQAIANPGTTVRLAAGLEYIVNGDLLMDACRSVVLEGGAGPAQIGGTRITRVGSSAVQIGWPGGVQPTIGSTGTFSVSSTAGVFVGQYLRDIDWTYTDSPNEYLVTAFVANTSITLKNLGSSSNDPAGASATAADFVQPAPNATVPVTFTTSNFTQAALYVIIGGAQYQVVSVVGTAGVIRRVDSAGVTTGTTVNAGAIVSCAVPAGVLRSTEAIVQMRSTYGCAVERLTLSAYNAATFCGVGVNGDSATFASGGALNTVEYSAFINNLYSATTPVLVASGMGAPSVSITGTCGFALDVVIEILSSTTFRYSVDGGRRWEGAIAHLSATTCTITTTFALPVWSNGFGLTFNFPAGTYTTAHKYVAQQGMQRGVSQTSQFCSDVRKCSFFGMLDAVVQQGADNRTLQCITNQCAGYNHSSTGGNDIQVDMETEGGGNGYGRAGVYHRNTIRPSIFLHSGDQTAAGPLVTLVTVDAAQVDGTMAVAPGGGAALLVNGGTNLDIWGSYYCDAIVNAAGPQDPSGTITFHSPGGPANWQYYLDANGTFQNNVIIGSHYNYVSFFGNGIAHVDYLSVNSAAMTKGRQANLPFAIGVANGTNVDVNSSASTIYLTSATGAFSLDGFVAGMPGQRLKVISAIAQQLTVVHQSGTETVAAAKIRTPGAANRVFAAPASGGFLELEFLYVPSGVFGTACWVLIGSSVTTEQYGTATLVAGTVSIAATITASSVIMFSVKTPANHSLTVDYAAFSADRSVGAPGSFKITAIIAAGTINTADTSTVDWVVVNP